MHGDFQRAVICLCECVSWPGVGGTNNPSTCFIKDMEWDSRLSWPREKGQPYGRETWTPCWPCITTFLGTVSLRVRENIGPTKTRYFVAAVLPAPGRQWQKRGEDGNKKTSLFTWKSCCPEVGVVWFSWTPSYPPVPNPTSLFYFVLFSLHKPFTKV